MSVKKTTPPPRPIGELVDELGRVRRHIAGLEKIEGAIRAEIASRGVAEAEGAEFKMSIVSAVRWTLDTKAVKAEMGAAWYDARCRQTATSSVRITPRIAEPSAAELASIIDGSQLAASAAVTRAAA